jgi:23S rRNA-/tRNA-specific pseudouridylate synthase
VHRLDSGTSGALLAARSRATYARLRSIFMRTAIKDYIAVVHGVRPPQDRITLPIAHMPRRPRRMCVCRDAANARALAARRAETIYRTIESDGDGALLAVRIRTGARHQIRVHLAAQGRAIIGDDLYDRANTSASPRSRLLLHAYRLRLRDSEQSIAIDCIAPLPDEFSAVLTARGWRSPRASDWDDL